MEILYDYNIDGLSHHSPRETLTARLDLAMQLDEWCQNLDHSMQVLQHFNTTAWSPETLESMRWSIILSIHHYFSFLLINAPVLKMGLAEIQKQWPSDAPSSTLQDATKDVLRSDFEGAKKLQTLIHGLHSFGGPFINSNAIWFLCNYSSMCHCPRLATCIHALTNRATCSIYDFTPRLRSSTVSYKSKAQCSRPRTPYGRG